MSGLHGVGLRRGTGSRRLDGARRCLRSPVVGSRRPASAGRWPAARSAPKRRLARPPPRKARSRPPPRRRRKWASRRRVGSVHHEHADNARVNPPGRALVHVHICDHDDRAAPPAPSAAPTPPRGSPRGARAAQAEDDPEQAGEQQPHPDQSQAHRRWVGQGGAISAAGGPNNVAPPPQLVAGAGRRAGGELASSAASAQALAFYRIPLFLLPIYQAAAVQYGVPWQILAAINEIETDYGTDQSVSTAGAVGWMQFMPATWLQYGVDALNAGYADPTTRWTRSSPPPAICAPPARPANLQRGDPRLQPLRRIRRLGAAARQADLHLSRVRDRHAHRPRRRAPAGDRQAHRLGRAALGAGAHCLRLERDRARAVASDDRQAGAGAATSARRVARRRAPRRQAPRPRAAAGERRGHCYGKAGTAPQFVDLLSAPNAAVVAVQDGRIVKLGSSPQARQVRGPARCLRRRVHLRRARQHRPQLPSAEAPPDGAGEGPPRRSDHPMPRSPRAPPEPAAGDAAGQISAASAQAAPSARPPQVAGQASRPRASDPPGRPSARCACSPTPATPTRAAAAARATRHAAVTSAGRRCRCGADRSSRRAPCSATCACRSGAKDGHLRFAIRPPATRARSIPRTILANWTQLDAALHPQGAKGQERLLGATASECSCCPRAGSSARCSPTPASRCRPALATKSPRVRSTSACWRCSRSSRAAA